MKRAAVFAVAVVAAIALPAAASGPTIGQVAAIVAGHKPAFTSDQTAEDDCLRAPTGDPCDVVRARVDRAEADAKDSLSLAQELEKAVGKSAQRAPKTIRQLTRQTIGRARTVVNHTNKWLACLKANAARPVGFCDRSLGYLDDFFALSTLLTRWGPYLP